MWYTLLFLVFATAAIANANVRYRFNNEDMEDSLTSIIPKPTMDLLSNSVKHKRCSYNLKSPSDLKIHLEQKRLEALCKFCLKSDIHMKLPLCKKCENIYPSISPYLQRNSNANEKILTTTNKMKEIKTNIENTGLDKSETLAHLNTNIRESLLRLMKSTFPTQQIMETMPILSATQTTKNDAGQLSKINSWNTEHTDILENSPSNMPSTYLEDSNKIQENNFELLENLRRKRLKDQLTHDDYLNILKQALRSEKYLHSIDLQKRDSNQTINKEVKEKLLNDILSKHVLELDSSEEDINISEIVGLEKGTTHDSTITKITTKELTTEKFPSTTLQESGKTVKNTNVRNYFGSTQQARFNYKKHPREKLAFRNNEWIETKEPIKNDNIDEILEKIAPNIQENNITNSQNITENTKTTTEKIIPIQTTKKISTKSDLLNKIKNRYFINRHLYTKNPRLKSVYENGKHKYILTNTTNVFETTESVTTNKTSKQDTNELDETDIEDLIKLSNPTKYSETEIKKINTRSTKNIPSQKDNKIDKDLMTEDFLNSLEEVEATAPNVINKHEVIKKVLPINLNQSKSVKKQDIFSKNLNMHPKINLNKYKNIVNNKNNPSLATLTSQENNLQNSENKKVQFLENRINLPLILKQSEDGKIQLILDKTEICNCSSCVNSTEKYVFKRKTSSVNDDNLTKYPLNIFNILEKHHDQSTTHVNNYLQMANNQNDENDLKEQFYKYLINDQLFKLFHSLNIPVDSSAELHSYIDELPDKEKSHLNQYVINSMSKHYINNENEINKELFNMKQVEFIENLINKQNKNNIIERTTESNRLTFKIKSENLPEINYNDPNIMKTFIQNEIEKQIKNTNICPMCNKHSCTCNNDKVYLPQNDYSNEGRVIDKRHYNHIPNKQNMYQDQKDNVLGIGTKYKIMNNFVNWARDIIVNNKTEH